MEKHKLCKPTSHKWLEAIDVDSSGNLYFTDAVRKILYRLKRKQADTMELQPLLQGFKHLGGVSIDRENNNIYLGVRLEENHKVNSKIIQIPLTAFGEGDKLYDYLPDFGNEPFVSSIKEYDLRPSKGGFPPPAPNGVVFYPNSKSVYYTHEDIFGWNGYLGNTFNTGTKNFITPNGIDIDFSSPSPVLVVSLFRKSRIIRFDFSAEGGILKERKDEEKHIPGLFPDGIFCLENGGLLVAAPVAGRVYHLPWDGNSYGEPQKIADGLDQPTDLVIGPSSNGKGKSLYVTTTKILKVYLGGGGNVFEIPDICKFLKQS